MGISRIVWILAVAFVTSSCKVGTPSSSAVTSEAGVGSTCNAESIKSCDADGVTRIRSELQLNIDRLNQRSKEIDTELTSIAASLGASDGSVLASSGAAAAQNPGQSAGPDTIDIAGQEQVGSLSLQDGPSLDELRVKKEELERQKQQVQAEIAAAMEKLKKIDAETTQNNAQTLSEQARLNEVLSKEHEATLQFIDSRFVKDRGETYWDFTSHNGKQFCRKPQDRNEAVALIEMLDQSIIAKKKRSDSERFREFEALDVPRIRGILSWYRDTYYLGN